MRVYKNFAPLGLENNIHANLHEFRSAAADSNTKYMLVYMNFLPLGLEYNIHADLQEYRSAAAESITKMMFCCSAFQLQRSGILVENI